MTRLEAPTAPSIPAAAPVRATAPARPSARVFLELTKPGITRMVAITVGVGFGLGWIVSRDARPGAPPADPATDALRCFFTLLGASLASAGAGALNEWWERDLDARMRRTAGRPIPSGRLSARQALLTGALCAAAGVGLLFVLVNAAAAALAAATIASYILVYTPLKPRTTLSTLVGSVPGALPPLIGWAGGWSAAAGSTGAAWNSGFDSLLHAGGWSLFFLLAVWQVPHFLAIAWMHREDYARAGHRVLPVVDPSGVRTAWTCLLWTLLLIPVSLFPIAAMRAQLGALSAGVAFAFGLVFLAAAAALARSRSRAAARRLFFASILYLPLVMAALVADAALVP